MKKTLLITATVFVVLISVLVFVAIILNSPSLVATRAVAGAVDDFSARKEFKPIIDTLSSAFEYGSMDVSFKNLTENGGDYWDKETSFMGKLYFSKNAMLLDDVNLTLNGERISGEAYVSDEYIYVKEDNILKGTCGVYLPEFEYELKNSIFAPDSGSKYALDRDTYDRIITLNKNREDSKDIEKDIERLSRRVGRDVWKIFLE